MMALPTVNKFLCCMDLETGGKNFKKIKSYRRILVIFLRYGPRLFNNYCEFIGSNDVKPDIDFEHHWGSARQH